MKRSIHLIYSGTGGNAMIATLDPVLAQNELTKALRTYPTAHLHTLELEEDKLKSFEGF